MKKNSNIEISKRIFLQKLIKLAKNQYLLSFLLPTIIFSLALYFNDIYPINPSGGRSIFMLDFSDQYFPFVYEFTYRLRTGGSLLWSWNLGGGSNYLFHYAYYLTSPFNILAAFFPSSLLREVLTIFVVIKIGLAGLFMAMYLNYVTKKKDILLPAFASLYALCGWMLIYYHNIIWVDVAYIAPLVILGAHRLIIERRYKLYVISFALALFLNFHIAFMLALFIILYFFAIAIINYNNLKDFLINGLYMALSTLLAIGLSAWLIIPVFSSLLSFDRFQSDVPTSFSWLRSWYLLFSEFLAFSANPTFSRVVASDAPPNVYTSLIALMLFSVFLISKEIKLKEKIVYTVSLLFLILSVNNNMLQFAWHGFSTTIGFPFRFSFLLSLLLAMLAYKAYIILAYHGIRKKDIVALVVGIIPFLIAGHLSLEEERNILVYNYVLGLSIILAIVLLYIAYKNNYDKMIMPIKICICLIIFVELSFSSFFAASMTGENNIVNNYSEILLSRNADNNDFFRTDFTRMNRHNEISLNHDSGINGISFWSSAINQATASFYQDMGIPVSIWSSRYIYFETSPLTNAFLNIRYLVERDDNPAGDEHFFERIAQVDDTVLLRNNYYLPLGFMVNNEFSNWQGDINHLFVSQNELFRAATGLEGDLFQIHTLTYDSEDGIYRFDFTMPEEGDLFSVSTLRVHTRLYEYPHTVRHIGTNYPAIHHLGSFEENTHIRLGFHRGDDRGERTIEVAIIDRELFANGHALLNQNTLDIASYSDTNISGYIDVASDGLLYTSIPYDNGNWRAYVNGERIDITLIKDAMIGIELEAGSFEIEFRYVNSAFNIGLGLSLISLTIFVSPYLLKLLKIKKQK